MMGRYILFAALMLAGFAFIPAGVVRGTPAYRAETAAGRPARIILAADEGGAGTSGGAKSADKIGNAAARPVKKVPKKKSGREERPGEIAAPDKLPVSPPSVESLPLVRPDLWATIPAADRETITAIGQALAEQIQSDDSEANKEIYGELARNVLSRVEELDRAEREAEQRPAQSVARDTGFGDCGEIALCADLQARVREFAKAAPTLKEEDGGLVTEIGRSMFDSGAAGRPASVGGETHSDIFGVEAARRTRRGGAADLSRGREKAERVGDETRYTRGKVWNPNRPMSAVPAPKVARAEQSGGQAPPETRRESEAAAAPRQADERPIVPKGVRISFQAEALTAAMAVGLSVREIEDRLLAVSSADAFVRSASWSSDEAARYLLRDRRITPLDEIVMVSVRALVDGARAYGGRWEAMPDSLRYPGPMRRIHGYIVDEAAGDVRIIGAPGGVGTPISLDELVVGVDAVWRNGAEPLVSLDPDPNDMEGPHQARVQGVPFDSMFAKIMLDADYEMKFVTILGRDVPFADFRSSLQRLRDQGVPEGVTRNRYWFVPGRPGPGEILTTPDGRAVLFDGAMVLQTEQMALSGGVLSGLGKRSPMSEAIASDFNARLEDFETAFGVFRRLHGVMDISLMATLWRTTKLDLPVLRELAMLPVPPVRVRQSYPGIYREEAKGPYTIYVAGGVSLNQRPAAGALLPMRLPGLDALADRFETRSGQISMLVDNAALEVARGRAGGPRQKDDALLRAAQLLNAGETERAFLHAERILGAEPNRADVLTLRAEAAMELGLFRLAARDLHRVYALTGAAGDTRVAFTRLAIREGTLSDFDAIPPSDRAALAVQFLARAVTLLALRNDIDGAYPQTEIALRLAPEMSQAYAARGGIRLARGDLEAAAADLDRAIGIDSGASKYHLLRAIVAFRSGDYAPAAKHAGAGMHLAEGRDLFEYAMIRGVSRICLGNERDVCDAAHKSLQRSARRINSGPVDEAMR